jgi:hypothetical protein
MRLRQGKEIKKKKIFFGTHTSKTVGDAPSASGGVEVADVLATSEVTSDRKVRKREKLTFKKRKEIVFFCLRHL